MPDRLHALLNAEADRRVAGQAVPPVSSVGVRRTSAHRSSVLRTAGPMIAAAAAVVAVVLVAGQLRPGAAVPALEDAPTAAAPSDPELGTMSIPPVIRRLGESMSRQAVRVGRSSSPVPDRVDVLGRLDLPRGPTYLLGLPASGTTCTYQTLASATGTVTAGNAGCGGGGGGEPLGRDGAVVRLGDTGVTGTSGALQNVMELRAPSGTASIRLTAPGTRSQQVPTYRGGSRWQDASFAIALWAGGQGTTAVALRADGSPVMAGRGSPPASVAGQASGGEPALGTIATPPELKRFFTPNGPDSGLKVDVPQKVDVLARATVGPTQTAWLVGFVSRKKRCIIQYVVDTARLGSGGGGAGCGKTGLDEDPKKLSLERYYSGGMDSPTLELLYAGLPPKTATLRLTAKGRPAQDVPATSGGTRWEGRSYVVASWPYRLTTRGEALAAAGTVLARTKS